MRKKEKQSLEAERRNAIFKRDFQFILKIKQLDRTIQNAKKPESDSAKLILNQTMLSIAEKQRTQLIESWLAERENEELIWKVKKNLF